MVPASSIRVGEGSERRKSRATSTLFSQSATRRTRSRGEGGGQDESKAERKANEMRGAPNERERERAWLVPTPTPLRALEERERRKHTLTEMKKATKGRRKDWRASRCAECVFSGIGKTAEESTTAVTRSPFTHQVYVRRERGIREGGDPATSTFSSNTHTITAPTPHHSRLHRSPQKKVMDATAGPSRTSELGR